MPQPKVTNWRDVNKETVVFLHPKRNSHHGLSVPIRLDGSDGHTAIYVQTPIMRLPFGISDKTGEYGRKIEANLSFPGYLPTVDDNGNTMPGWDTSSDEGKTMSEFFSWSSWWDENNKEQAKAKNQKERKWFGQKQISDVVVDELYKPNVKMSSEPGKYSPTIRVKIATTKGDIANGIPEEPNAEFYDHEMKPLKIGDVQKGSRVIALIKITALWFAGKSFGMNFTLVQMVQLSSDRFTGCAISIPRNISTKRSTDDYTEDSTDHKKLKIMESSMSVVIPVV